MQATSVELADDSLHTPLIFDQALFWSAPLPWLRDSVANQKLGKLAGWQIQRERNPLSTTLSHRD